MGEGARIDNRGGGVGVLRRTSLALAALLAAASPARANCTFAGNWVAVESGDNPLAANGASTAIGRWQMTQAAFADVGLISRTSEVTAAHYGGRDWTNVSFNDNPFGIRTLQDLRNNPAVQDYYGRLYFAQLWQQAGNSGLVRDFVGRTVDIGGRQVAINESSLLTCMGYLGPGDCSRMLRGEAMTSPGNVAHALYRMNQAAPCDGSDIAEGNTPVAPGEAVQVAAPGGAGGGQYCDPQVRRMLEQAATARVDAVTAMAGHPEVGYRTAEGRSPLVAAGGDLLRGLGLSLPSSPGEIFGTSGFRALSCFDRLLGGINIIFAPPNIGAILSALEGQVCRQIEQLYARAVAPLNRSFFRSFDIAGVSVPFGAGMSVGGAPGLRFDAGTMGGANFDFFGTGGSGAASGQGERRGLFAR